MSLLSDTINDKRFSALDNKGREETLAKVKTAMAQNHWSEDEREYFDLRFEEESKATIHEMTLSQADLQPSAMGNRFNKLPETIPEAIDDTIEANKRIHDIKARKYLETDDKGRPTQGLQYPIVSPEIAALGLTRAGMGAVKQGIGKIAGNRMMQGSGEALKNSGMAFAKGSIVGDFAAHTGLEAADAAMGEEFQKEHPTLSTVLKFGTAIASGVLFGSIAERRTLMKYYMKYKKGGINGEAMEAAMKQDPELNKALKKFNSQKYLKETTQPKVSDGFEPKPVNNVPETINTLEARAVEFYVPKDQYGTNSRIIRKILEGKATPDEYAKYAQWKESIPREDLFNKMEELDALKEAAKARKQAAEGLPKNTKAEDAEANTLFSQGGATMGGAFAGATEGLYEEMVEGKDLSAMDYAKRIGGGALVGMGASKLRSKMVDDISGAKIGAFDGGKPKTKLYHGTDAEFDEFGKMGDRLTSMGYGHYFTPSLDKAKQYGKKIKRVDLPMDDILDWNNLSKPQRKAVEKRLKEAVPKERLAGYGEYKKKYFPEPNKMSPIEKDEAIKFFDKKKAETKHYYHDRAKAVLDGDEKGTYVGWMDEGLGGAKNEDLLALAQEFDHEIARWLGYKGAKFGDEVAVYDTDLVNKSIVKMDDGVAMSTTRDKNFQKWFKGSSDELKYKNGTPKTLYHGTPDARGLKEKGYFETGMEQGIDVLTPKGQKSAKDEAFYYFTDSKKVANSYAKEKLPFDYMRAEPSVESVYLNFKKPFIIDMKNKKWDSLHKKLVKAKSEGYDGAVVKNVVDDYHGKGAPATNYIAFKKEQIKSIHNKGTFDPNDANILYAQGAGLAGGLEEDEDGNIQYNMLKGLGIAAGLGATMHYTPKLYGMFRKGKIKNPAFGLPEETKFQLFRRTMQDKFIRVKQLIKVKADGQKIADAMNPYQAEELYTGRAQSRIEGFQKKTVEPLLKKIAKSGYSVDEVDKYLHARHAGERNARMLEQHGVENGSGMADADASAILEKYAGTGMEDVANSVYAMNRGRLSLILDEGLESKDFIKMMDETYDNYVPLQRVMDVDSPATRTGKGFDIKGKETKRAKGSHREVESPLLHSILAFQETIIRAEKNQVGKTFLKFIEEFPDNTLYEVQSLKHMPQYDNMGEVVGVNPQYKLQDNVMHVKVDGKIKEIVIHDPALAAAFKNMNATQMNALMKASHKMVRFLASVSTQYNPEFVVSNFQRDLQTALINIPDGMDVSRGRILRDVGAAIAGIYKQERGGNLNQWSKLFEEMKAEGGATGWLDQYDVPEMKGEVESLIKEYSGEFMPSKPFKAVLQYVDDVNTAVENGVRLVSYKMGLDSGMTKKQSASLAKNLTVNFNRKGEQGTAINSAYMFYTASIGGSTRMLQALKSKKAQAFATGIMGLTVGLYYYNTSQNKEEYEKIPDHIKDTNYIFMKPDGTYYKVRVPYGYNVFKTMGDMIAETSDGMTEPKQIPGRLFSSLANAFNPVGTAPTLSQTLSPTLLDPVVQIEENKNFFGAPIKPEGNPFAPEDKAEAFIHYKSVNPMAKDAAQGINKLTGGSKHERGMIDISPEHIEHIVEFAAGGLGKFLNRSYKTGHALATGEDIDTNQIPFLRGVKGKPYEKAGRNIAYKMLKDAGRKKYSEREAAKFKRLVLDGIKRKDIEPIKGLKMLKQFTELQSKVGWSREQDVGEDVSKEQIKEAIKKGLPPKDIKKMMKSFPINTIGIRG